MGIVFLGTKSYCLFTDPSGGGHKALRDYCVSRDRARVKEIGMDRVTLELRGDAAPGAPAPQPKLETWIMHQDDLALPNKSSDS